MSFLSSVNIGGDIPDSTLTQDLVAWYRYEDGNVKDYTSSLSYEFADTTAYNGTVSGASHQSSGSVTDVISGSNSGYFDFTSDSDSISYSDPPQVEKATEFTIMGWANPNISDTMTIYGTGRDDANNNVELRTDGVRVETGGNRAQAVVSSQPQVLSHFVLVWSAPDVEFYIDATSKDEGQGPSQSMDTLDAFTGRYFSGSLDMAVDDIRVYNRALTSSEITDIYNNTKP